MDEGWTRWVMDDFKLPYVSLGDSAVRAGSLRKRFDVIVIPDLSLREVRDGMTDAQVPPRRTRAASARRDSRRLSSSPRTVVISCSWMARRSSRRRR